MDVTLASTDKIQVDFDCTKLEDFCDSVEDEDLQRFESVGEENYESYDDTEVQTLCNLFTNLPNNFEEITKFSPITAVTDTDENRNSRDFHLKEVKLKKWITCCK